jgi:hypothetical protein
MICGIMVIKWISLQRGNVTSTDKAIIDEEIKEPNNLFDFWLRKICPIATKKQPYEVFGGLLHNAKKQI